MTVATLFVEGLPGSGKSVSSTNLAGALQKAGHGVALYQETEAEHPLRVGELDDIGAAMADVHLRYTTAEFAQEALSHYKSFAAQTPDPPITIFESFPIQTHVRVLMQMDASPEIIWSFWSELQQTLAHVNPALIYFETTDPKSSLQKTMRMRGPEWSRYVIEALEQTPYATARNLRGSEGILEMLRQYGDLMEAAVARWTFPKLILPSRPPSYADRDAQAAVWAKAQIKIDR